MALTTARHCVCRLHCDASPSGAAASGHTRVPTERTACSGRVTADWTVPLRHPSARDRTAQLCKCKDSFILLRKTAFFIKNRWRKRTCPSGVEAEKWLRLWQSRRFCLPQSLDHYCGGVRFLLKENLMKEGSALARRRPRGLSRKIISLAAAGDLVALSFYRSCSNAIHAADAGLF